MKILKCAPVICFSLCLLASSLASANWSWGIGHRNPPGSVLGVNFMHLWSNWAFEVGIGHIGGEIDNDDEDEDDDESSSLTVAGDINMKYLFSSGGIRPYLQAGIGSGLAASDSGLGAGASFSHPFAGGGLFFFGNGFHIYVSYLFINAQGFQFGIGF